jgi:hypothetical protein
MGKKSRSQKDKASSDRPAKSSTQSQLKKPLPFEPKPTGKQAESSAKQGPAQPKKSSATPQPKIAQPPKASAPAQPKPVAKAASTKTTSAKAAPVTSNRGTSGIPEVVSQRMLKRMLLLCGVPTVLGLLTFPTSYWVITQGWLELPNVAVVLVSMGLFGLGVLGLSYGVLSASWDEGNPGSLAGWDEFKLNWGRMRGSWRDRRK